MGDFVSHVPMQVATAFVDGRLPRASSLLLGSGGGSSSRGHSYTPGPAVMVQVRFRSLSFGPGGWEEGSGVEADSCAGCVTGAGGRGGGRGGWRGGWGVEADGVHFFFCSPESGGIRLCTEH